MKIKDAYSSESTYGVFRSLYAYFGSNYEWLTETNAPLWDSMYIKVQSGEKTASPFLEDGYKDLSYIIWRQVATYCDMLFRDKWTKLYAVMSAEYNPIENYSMTQEEKPNITRSHTGANVDTNNLTRTVKNKQTVTQNNSNDVYGFNSSNPVHDSKGSNTTETVGLGADNEETNTGTVTHAIGETETETGKRTTTRSGNIGVTTSQQMLQSEIDLWQWLFFKQVFADIDSIIALSVYDI